MTSGVTESDQNSDGPTDDYNCHRYIWSEFSTDLNTTLSHICEPQVYALQPAACDA